jgi:hypothetical protein
MVVVLWIMDNSLYFAEDEEGARVLPKRGEDGKYHIEGQLKLASGKKATKALEKFLPVLRRMKKNKKVILVPSPRHICQPCCQETHCTNRGEAGFLPGILEGTKDIRRAVRDACHEWRVTNYKVVNGCTLLGLHENSGYEEWEGAMGTDSVHLTEMAYRKIAESITQMSEGRDAVFSGGKRELEEEEERPAPTILGRKAWVYGPNTSHAEGAEEGVVWAAKDSPAADVEGPMLACMPAATGLARLCAALVGAAATAATTTATATSADTPARKCKWKSFPMSLSYVFFRKLLN